MGAFEVVDYEGLRYLCSRSTGVVQGHICLEAPHVPAVPYLRAALSTLLLDDCFSGARNILLIGLGAGVVPRFILRNFPSWHVTVVEICPEVIDTAVSHFYFPKTHPRLTVVCGCGDEYIKTCNRTFDWIFVDGFDQEGLVGPLLSSDFIQNCQRTLNPSSSLVVNSIALHENSATVSMRLQGGLGRQVHVIELTETPNFLSLALPSGFSASPKVTLFSRAGRLKLISGLDLSSELDRLPCSAL